MPIHCYWSKRIAITSATSQIRQYDSAAPSTVPKTLGAIIPVYNDASALRLLLPQLRKMLPATEVLVVDGGSNDGSVEAANSHGVRLIASTKRGRAVQMNEGAAASRSDILLFLHADTLLPPNANERILHAIANGRIGGAFSRRFDSPSLLLKLTCWLADWRGRWFGWFLGDQAIFVRRDLFEQIGGFPKMKRFEDLDFSRAMAKRGPTALLKPTALTSARRFEQRGPIKQTLNDFFLTIAHLLSSLNRKQAGKSEPGKSE